MSPNSFHTFVSMCFLIVCKKLYISFAVLLLNLQYVSLNEKDVLKIHQLDSNLTELGTVTTNQSHVPQIAVSANVGLLVDVVQADCKVKKDKIILIGHSSYMPGM